MTMRPIDAAWNLLKQKGRVLPINQVDSPFPKGLTPMQERDALARYHELLSLTNNGQAAHPEEEATLNHLEGVLGY